MMSAHASKSGVGVVAGLVFLIVQTCATNGLATQAAGGSAPAKPAQATKSKTAAKGSQPPAKPKPAAKRAGTSQPSTTMLLYGSLSGFAEVKTLGDACVSPPKLHDTYALKLLPGGDVPAVSVESLCQKGVTVGFASKSS
ncbi:MAG TPA: hypothetical protein VL523_03650, partial [Terriglobia bacterium]|nr:hypothetical protein [Terriglobia bacterium]